MVEVELGIIGGSGLYDMAELSEVSQRQVTTPFGAPSDSLTIGWLHGRRVAFLPRHGRGHLLAPSEVPYRANIYALKSLGARYIISVSACGSLQESYEPGHVVVPDQLFDHTKGLRDHSFFGEGLVAHVGVADPFSPELSAALADAVQAVGGTVHVGGTYITVEGPRFSTRGESNIYRSWGVSIIGMTTSPEAFLAAEAQMAYACLAHVTDYDVWHHSEEPVTVERVLRTSLANTALAKKSISELARRWDHWAGEFAAHSTLRDAVVTDQSLVPPARQQALALLFGDQNR